MSLVVVVSLLLFSGIGQSAHCAPPTTNAAPNLHAVLDSNMQFLEEVENGKLYIAGSPQQQLYVVHLYGTPYEMGYAQGKLLTDVVVQFVTQVWEYMMAQIPGAVIFYPDLANRTMEEALQLEIDATQEFTPDYWREEMRGLSDATGLGYEDIYRVHMLPELTKGDCTMVGAWGDATRDSLDGVLLQLRALDWSVDGPFKNFAAIQVYHPSAGNGNAFAMLGFTGFVGAVTGISSKRLSISEIGVYFSDDSWGRESRFGYPFIFMLRDILQFDASVDDSTKRLEAAHRTCDLLLGVGSGVSNEFRGYKSSHSVLTVYDWYNLEPNNATWHPRIEDIVYWGMDYICPGYDAILSSQLQQYYGNINAQNMMQSIVARTQTGDLHIAIYDYSTDDMYVSIAAKSDDNSLERNAYQRPYIRFPLAELFQETQ